MKRNHLIAALLIFAMLLTLSSCIAKQPPIEESTASTTEAASPDSSSDSANAPSDGEDTENTENDTSTDSGFSTDLYDVTRADGVCYLNFRDGNELTDGEQSHAAQQVGYIEFPSVEDMYEKISKGQLTDQQITVIKYAFNWTEAGCIFPDIHALCLPSLPAGLQRNGVGLTNDVYTISFGSSDSSVSGGAKFSSEGQYRATYEKSFTNFYDNDNLSEISLSEGEFDGIPCEVGQFKTSAAAFRLLRFTMENEGKKLSVQIRYCLESFRGDIAESDTYPRRVEIYCEQDGRFMIVTMHDLQIVPSAEWLASFGIVPFVPAA